MSTPVKAAPRLPAPGWWSMLGVVLGSGLIAGWTIAAAVLAFLLAQAARPFDFLTAFFIVAAGSSFVANEAGGLTYQLGLLTAAALFMLMCYVITNRERLFSITRSPLTWPLLSYLTLSIANAARGLLSGYPLRNLGLEFLPLLALATAFLIANAFDPRTGPRTASLWLIVIALGPTIQGFVVFSIVRQHTVGVYTMAVPAIAGLFLINLALRSPRFIFMFGYTLLSIPMFLHQFLTFGRGLWTGCLAGLAISAVTFAGAGRGSGPRWRRVGLVLLLAVGLGVAGAVQTALFFNQMDILGEAGSRFASITSTKSGYETRSNIIRLGEYAAVAKWIAESPWVGHGIGFTFPIKQAYSRKAAAQWWVHQNFLLILLKQGLIGLALFLWTIGTATLTGVREARRRLDAWESSWFATSAATTAFLAVLSLSNFPFAVVNEMFFLALLWGGTMAMTRTGFVTLRWSHSKEAAASA